jgi:hypothetical protein
MSCLTGGTILEKKLSANSCSCFTLIRCLLLNWFPYPYLKVSELVYPAVSLNNIVMLVGFFLAGFGLMTIHKKIYH